MSGVGPSWTDYVVRAKSVAKVDVVGSNPITRSTPIRPRAIGLRAFSLYPGHDAQKESPGSSFRG